MSRLGSKILDLSVALYLLLSLAAVLRVILYKYLYQVELSRTQIYSPMPDIEGRIVSSVYVTCMLLKSVCGVFASFSLLRSLSHSDSKRTVLVCFAMLFDAFAFSAKGPIIGAGFIFLLYLLIGSNTSRLTVFTAAALALPLATGLWLIEVARGNDLLSSVSSYFSIGPTLLSSIVDGGFESGYKTWTPLNLFAPLSGLEYLATILLRTFDASIANGGYDWVKYIDIPIVFSSNSFKFIPYNTFYTILAEAYISLGFLGVILLGIGIGWAISDLEFAVRQHRCDHALFWLQYLTAIGFFGVFVSPFSSVTFWLILILMTTIGNNLFIDDSVQDPHS